MSTAPKREAEAMATDENTKSSAALKNKPSSEVFAERMISFRQKKAGQLAAVGIIKASFMGARQPGPSEVSVGNVPLPPKAKFTWPAPAITLFYGKAGDAARVAYNRTLAQTSEICVPIEFTVDCGKIFSSDLKLEDLPEAGLIRTNYMSTKVENVLVGYWRKRLIDEGFSERELSLMDWHDQTYIAARPDLLAGLRQTEEFGHVKAISWVTAWGSVSCGFLTILDPSAVSSVVGGWAWGDTKITALFS